MFSGLVKIGTPSTERVRAYGVVGGGIAQRRTERAGTFGRDFAPVPTTTPFHETLTDYVWALTAGVDIVVELTDHLSFLGSADSINSGTPTSGRTVSSTVACRSRSFGMAEGCS